MDYKDYEFFRNKAGYKNNAAVSKETGIAPATFSEWKQGKYVPKNDKLEKIRILFGIDMSEFYDLPFDITADDYLIERVYLKDDERSLLDRFNKLDDEAKKQLLTMAAFLCATKNKERD